jgi:hypothetical protein
MSAKILHLERLSKLFFFFFKGGLLRCLIDPELLLRILRIGYLHDITSERKMVEELRIQLAGRWFTGLGFDQEIPHHSTVFEKPAWTVSRS